MNPSQEPRTGDITQSTRLTDPFEGLTSVEVDVTIEGTTALAIDVHSNTLSWCIQPNGTDCSSAMRRLGPGDRVTISSPDGRILFDGPLTGTTRFEAIRIYRPVNEHTPPPLGFAVYWSPNGIDPHDWLSLFEGRNNVTMHRHSIRFQSAEQTAAVDERLKVS